MFVILMRKFKSSTLARAIKILPKRDRKKILAVAILQVSLGFLDLAGVAVIGVIGALAINGVSATGPGNRVGELLKFLHLGSYNLQTQALILGISAAILLVSKTVISMPSGANKPIPRTKSSTSSSKPAPDRAKPIRPAA